MRSKKGECSEHAQASGTVALRNLDGGGADGSEDADFGGPYAHACREHRIPSGNV